MNDKRIEESNNKHPLGLLWLRLPGLPLGTKRLHHRDVAEPADVRVSRTREHRPRRFESRHLNRRDHIAYAGSTSMSSAETMTLMRSPSLDTRSAYA